MLSPIIEKKIKLNILLYVLHDFISVYRPQDSGQTLLGWSNHEHSVF